ncbi:hypothetical protein ASG87_02830 [Frateuria sp. Soil773]|uniref:type VI secretion system lipoprotein TssJ n=1 Tax=Frateuria sp. Soil773 TaxID=1736407 RepID=UPI0006F61110|nr:type VI secretion system lipoprotein TssJ [Frateuria sp. Soil773]KRE89295.1 hypothetical protein ASG87_02830 [Frateuria sp. Soil773]
MTQRTAIPTLRATTLLPLMLATLLAGCASAGKTMDKAMSAIGLGKQEAPAEAPAKTRLPLHVFAGGNLNAGSGKKPLALVVKVYQLRSLQRFEQTPFDSFLDTDKERAALGQDLVDSHEMLVLPSQHYDIVEALPNDAPYLGVVALFRAPAAQRWRYAYDVKASMPAGITLGAHACALSSTAGKLVTDLADDPGSLASARCPDMAH